MESNKDIRLSQTMIVKNEEKNIRSALSWGREICCEQVVVDTGSTDGTVKLAEELGARVVSFKWIDDFSAAKNFALDQCSGDWIAILDADEYFSQEDSSKLLSIIEKAESNGASAINTSLISIDGKGGVVNKTTQVRIIKNIKNLRYKRRIHETLTYPGSLNVYDAVSELSIVHTGYMEEILKEKRASGRNRRMLEAELEREPDDPEILGYLADDYAMDESCRDKAIELYIKAIANLPDEIDERDTRTADTFTKLIILLSLEDRAEEINDLYHKAMEKIPCNGDFSYYTGVYLYNKKCYEEAYSHYKEAFDKLEKHPGEWNSENLKSNLISAYAQYGKILFELKDAKGAVSIESSVLKENKKEYTALTTILQAFYENGVSASMVLDYLGKIYDFDESLDKLLVYRAAKETGFSELSGSICKVMNEKELKLIGE
ncbi:glycosyl transferase [Lachnospiraceae bacterium JC7]|nr:glycosyl transferase [Lachnospiraceae bacterium JC7]